MASLHVRNIDEEIVDLLKRRASLHGRSAEAEHREILKAALQWDAPVQVDRQEWDRRTAALRERLKGRRHTPSEVLQRETRDER
jgi:plasmid stability protein